MLSNNASIKKNETGPSRPQIHFTPEKGWMNDPNGLLYLDGEYHLFYQHIPDRTDHKGLLHWGHAKSNDLFNWKYLSVALYPDNKGDIWSGSIVVDELNTGKFATGKEKNLVAIFTQENNGIQEQGLAISRDRGNTWIKYADNPIIPNPGLKDFRDPKVFWHKESNHWVMVLAAGQRVMIYVSYNLKDWNFVSEFGERDGCHSGTWECPDLFELVIDDEQDNKKWVLLVSVLDGAPNGGPGTQYFIGDFDGKKFRNFYPDNKVLWVDYGKDNYAGSTFSNIPQDDEYRIFIAWMNNWQYAQTIPHQNWCGMMTLPRELRLKKINQDEIRLVSFPVKEHNAQKKEILRLKKQLVSSMSDICVIKTKNIVPLELSIEFEIKTASEFGLLLKNEMGEFVRIGYKIEGNALFIDRRNSGLVDFDPNFANSIDSAPLHLKQNKIDLIVVIDMLSVELFANSGSVTLTNLVFPVNKYDQIKLYSLDGDVQLNKCTVCNLK